VVYDHLFYCKILFFCYNKENTENEGKIMRTEKTVSQSLTEQQYFIRPPHINHYGRLFGGQLLMWIDELAGVVAMRHCGTTVTTAAIDNLQFRAPACEGDLIVLQGRVTAVGRSSMEIRVDTFREALSGQRTMINRAYIDMVAIDSEGKPVEVPALRPETEEDLREWEAAAERRRMRKQQRIKE
jgi:acyl-CoA hydrolase